MTHIQRNCSFLPELDSLLMYINFHTKCQIFPKISIFFYKKIISFSSSGHLMENSTFFLKFHFFFFFLHKIDIFGRKLILREILVTLPHLLAQHDFIMYLIIPSFAQKLTLFCNKLTFFSKRKQRHQKLTLFKNKRYFFKKLNISTRN